MTQSCVFVTGATGYVGFERIPATRDSARRLGLVSLAQMVGTLLFAIGHRPSGIRVIDVPGIRECAA